MKQSIPAPLTVLNTQMRTIGITSSCRDGLRELYGANPGAWIKLEIAIHFGVFSWRILRLAA